MIQTYGLDFRQVREAYEGDMPDEQESFVEAKILEAFRLLYGLCPRSKHVPTWDVDRQGLVRDTVIRAVLRVIRDEDPTLKSESENGYSYTKDSLVSSGNLWFPDADLRALGCDPGSNAAGRRIGSVKTRPDPVFAGTQRRRVITSRGGWW